MAASGVTGIDTVVLAPTSSRLWGTVAASLIAAACAVAIVLSSDHIPAAGVHAALQVWGILGYTLAGVIAWWRRPDSRLGVLMLLAGAAWFLSSLSAANQALPFTIGIAFDLVPAVVFLHVFLAFPSGQLERPFERRLLAIGYAVAFGGQLLGMTLGGFGADNLLEVTSRAASSHRLLNLRLVILSVLCVAGIAVLIVRRRDSGRPLRRSLSLLVDSFALALLMIAFLFLSAAWGLASGEIAFETIRRATFFVVGLAPMLFLIGLLQARLARSAVGDLIVELRADPTPPDLRDALARALRDESLELAYWLPDFGTFAGADGARVELPDPHGRRATTVMRKDGGPVAVLLHDVSLEDEPELLTAVTAAAAIAIETTRLQVELRARLRELRGSRVRIIEAAGKERQRLERNLHDGAQQRLVALSLELSLLDEELAGDPEARLRVDRARCEVAASQAELREVARGIHPAVVTGHGLAVALEQLVALAPVPVRLTVDVPERLPEAHEVAAYYLVSESLANIGKYASASSATVLIRRTNDRVLVDIRDDGIGGADTERGTGLRGLADRVEALDGRLRIWSPVGQGTVVRAEMPCAP
jgi:signal transduction histidine kinase